MPRTGGLPGVITTTEAAKYLRVSKTTVLRLAKQGLIGGSKIGRQWRFSRNAIMNLINHSEFMQRVEATV